MRLKCTSVITELQPLVSSKMQRAMQKILNFNKTLTEERIEDLERTEEPEKPEKLEKSAKPEKPAKPEKHANLEKPAKPEKSGALEKSPIFEKPGKSDKLLTFEKVVVVEKSWKPEKLVTVETLEKIAKSENPVTFEKSSKVEKLEKNEKPVTLEKSGKPEKPAIAENSVKLGRPVTLKLSKFEKLGKPEKIFMLEKPGSLEKSTNPKKSVTPEKPCKSENPVKIVKLNEPENSGKSDTQTLTSNEVICIDVDSEEETIEEAAERTPKVIAPPATAPLAPKITVKKIQDLTEPTTSSVKTNPKIIDLKNFSLLRDKSFNNSENSVTSDSQKLPVSSENSSNSVARPISDASSSNCKTFTIKRSALGKKCPKFVIKTTNGKYMTIRAEDLKELPMKKLQPIAPNDPVISKLSNMTTKRIIMPAKGNGFLKLNFADKPSSSDKIVKSTVENVQQSNETSSSSSKQI